MLKRLLLISISLIALFFLIEPFIRLIYQLIMRTDYIVFNLPFVHLTKYFVVLIVLILFFQRYASTISPAGKRLLPIVLTFAIAGVITTVFSFHIISDEKLTKYRVVWWSSHTWDAVTEVKPSVHKKRQTTSAPDATPYSRTKIVEKYMIYFDDGAKINAWKDVAANYELHEFVLSQGVDVDYTVEAENFMHQYKDVYRDEVSKAIYIFLGKKGSF